MLGELSFRPTWLWLHQDWRSRNTYCCYGILLRKPTLYVLTRVLSIVLWQPVEMVQIHFSLRELNSFKTESFCLQFNGGNWFYNKCYENRLSDSRRICRPGIAYLHKLSPVPIWRQSFKPHENYYTCWLVKLNYSIIYWTNHKGCKKKRDSSASLWCNIFLRLIIIG